MAIKKTCLIGAAICSSIVLHCGCGSGSKGALANGVIAFGLPRSFNVPIDAPFDKGVFETLTVDAGAPVGGITFQVTSDDPTVVSVPASVSMAGGATSVEIPVTALRAGDTVLRVKAAGMPELTTNVRGIYSVCTLWGDSLTQGNQDGSGVTVETALQASGYCAKLNNEGMVGSTSTEIAVREGAVASTATISGGTIPGSGGVAISFKTGYDPVSYHAVSMTIQGVPGVLTYNGADSFTFTRITSGPAVASPPDSSFTVQVGDLNSGLVVIWVGTNNFTNGTQVQSDIAAMVATLPRSSHVLVLSVLNSDVPWLYAGQPYFQVITGLNASLAATYRNHFVDIRAALVGAANRSSAQDGIDQAHGVPPSTMRAQVFKGVITNAINDSVSCSFSVTAGTAERGSTLTVGTEKIYLSSTDGTNVSGCIRGYASTLASPHLAGTSFLGLDVVHLSGPVGDVFVAGQIQEWMRRN